MNMPVYTSMPYPVQQQMQQRVDMQNQQLMQQQIMQQQAQQPVLSPASRVVVSREEAIATPADFSGALMIFPDITNCVYIKHWNAQTGAAEFMDYFPPMPIAPQAQEQQPQPNQEPPAFASLQALADLQNMVNNQQQQLENIEKRLNQERLADKPNGKAEKKNDAK